MLLGYHTIWSWRIFWLHGKMVRIQPNRENVKNPAKINREDVKNAAKINREDVKNAAKIGKMLRMQLNIKNAPK